MLVMRSFAPTVVIALALLLACGKSDKKAAKNKPAPAKPSATVDAAKPVKKVAKTTPADAAPAAKPTIDAAVANKPPMGPPIANVVAAIASGKQDKTICFGWSAKKKRVACHTFSRSAQGGAEFRVQLLGAGGDKDRSFDYFEQSEGQFLGERPALAKIDKDEIAELRKALKIGSYAPLQATAHVLAPGGSIKLLGATVSRKRKKTGSDGDSETGTWDTFEETISVACGKANKSNSLDGDGVDVAAPTITYYELPGDLVLVTSAVTWSKEGDFGETVEARLLDKAKLCAAK